MARNVRIPALVAATFLVAAPLPAGPADEAAGVIERLYSALVAVATAEPAPAPDQRVEALAPVIESTHDLATMGRITVRRFWARWAEAERERFLDAFVRLSVTSYASRFATVGPDTFAILGAEAVDDDRVEVNALIRRRDAEDVAMDYLLRLDETGWRIVNVEADGVSELSLMASRYFDILESGDLDDLIAEIEGEIGAL